MTKQNQIQFEDFLKVDIRSGVILNAKLNPKAKIPAYELTIDFGDLGVKKSSAQITQNYKPEELIGMSIVAVMNFPPKKVAGVNSEVLVLASVCAENGTILLAPTKPTKAGSHIR